MMMCDWLPFRQDRGSMLSRQNDKRFRIAPNIRQIAVLKLTNSIKKSARPLKPSLWRVLHTASNSLRLQRYRIRLHGPALDNDRGFGGMAGGTLLFSGDLDFSA
jgi:hypothetical protein